MTQTTTQVGRGAKHILEEDYNVAVIGHEGSGVTSLIDRFTLDPMDSYDPTLDSTQIRWTTVDDDVLCRIATWDAYDFAECTAMREQCVRTCQGFVLVYSISSWPSFNRIRYFHSEIRRIRDPKPVPICLVGNKCDLGNNVRQVTVLEGEQLAAELGIHNFFEVSAKTNINVDEAFHAVVRTIRAIKDDEGRDVTSEKKATRPPARRKLLLSGRKPRVGKTQEAWGGEQVP